jgi:hypothetical protein
MITKNELGIFWASANGHIEVPGVYFMVFWGDAFPEISISYFKDVSKMIDSEYKLEYITAESGCFSIIPVWIKQWPTDNTWHRFVEITLNNAILNGAVAAWCGGEECSWTLDEINPETTSGCIYAACTSATGVIIHSELSHEISYISDSELNCIYNYVKDMSGHDSL